MVCVSRCFPGRWPGKSHGVAAMPPPVRRFGRLFRWSLSMPAKGSGTGMGSAPRDISVSRGVMSMAVVFSAAIFTIGWA